MTAANPNAEDYYAVLGLSRNCSDDEIRKAYKKAAIRYHPDKNKGDRVAEENFKRISEAFSVLSDQQKRAAYDRWGKDGARVAEQNEGQATPFRAYTDAEEMFRQFFGPQGDGFPFATGGGGATFFVNGRSFRFGSFGRQQGQREGSDDGNVPEYVRVLQQLVAVVPPPLLILGGASLFLVCLRVFSALAAVAVSRMHFIIPVVLFVPERMRPVSILGIVLLGLIGAL